MVHPSYIRGKLKAGKNRLKVLELLSAEFELTPKEIDKRTGIRINHVSRILKELKDMGLVKCITPELHVGRNYSITQKGKEILNFFKRKKT